MKFNKHTGALEWNKRGALELSITAIVVLIIAITVLGLGISFIKKQFGAGTSLVEQQLTGIREQLREQVRSGGELLVFSIPDKVNVGKPSGVVIGVRNTAANREEGRDRVCFRVEVKCIQPFTPDAYCDPRDTLNNIAVGGYDFDNDGFVSNLAPERNWFRTILGQFDLKDYDGDVYDAVLLVRGLKSDSYEMEVNVYKAIDDRACADDPDFSSFEDALYASKKFIVDVA
ncbi:hypothetical protein COV18_00390 [Candidatus Woesearchaeota archaeon CG10_big_fil_rev_8_21_14_0_10_37_12]|nr:MAG: hypothetical protein COV18_00390 [Candidatus Woesearchaeota archaeon CG10_big_fil_rev_8_21_14_0_10_37_12]